jgi:hypothetical protein
VTTCKQTLERFLSNNLDTLEKSAVFVYMSSRFTELTQFANEMDVVLKFFDLGMKIQDLS